MKISNRILSVLAFMMLPILLFSSLFRPFNFFISISLNIKVVERVIGARNIAIMVIGITGLSMGTNGAKSPSA